MRIPILSSPFPILLTSIWFGFHLSLVSSQCRDDQLSLLLQLKSNLTFYNSSLSTKLVHWNPDPACCQLQNGVICDEEGRVIGLDLANESISGGLEHSSLFGLQFLQFVNMSFNKFNFTGIPREFGNLTSLTSLNLSNAGFSGQIPAELSGMTRLVALDLSTLFFQNPPLKLENPNLSMFVRNLTDLRELYLDGVDISPQGYDWGEAISSRLPNLRVLSLSSCHLSGPIHSSLSKLRSLSVLRLGNNNLSTEVPEFFANFSNLTALHMGSCNLNGTFPETIFRIAKLHVVDISNNRLLKGKLPDFPRKASLHTLVLSHTNFSGSLPETIVNLGMLSRIELANCSLSGLIPNSLADLTQLEYLDLSSNMLTGPIPSFNMSGKLKYVDLSHNNFTGTILPSHFEGLLNLVNVDLGYNSFSGSIPSSLFFLPLLQKIQLSNNKFGGELHDFSNASSSLLDTLDLSSNNLGGPIPKFLFQLQKLNVLLLSSNNFSGSVQLANIRMLQNLATLELSHNNLLIDVDAGNFSLPSFPQFTTLKLASCKLQNFPNLENQSRMIFLDLSDNQIGGEVPNWIWEVGKGRLNYLNLSHNNLVGFQEPYAIPGLSTFDLHSNHFHGRIPMPPQSAVYVDYSSNKFNSSIPDEIGKNLTTATFLSLSRNNLSGIVPESICNASNLQVLDLSNNGLSGKIPSCLIERSALTLGVLSLGNNHLSGNILGTFPAHCLLETLNLNGNSLEGHVPKSLANCSMLKVIDIGNNGINDTFPCFLKNTTTLRVLVLRSNKFQGDLICGEGSRQSWQNLQIVDLAINCFTGQLPSILLNLKAMMVNVDNAQSEPNHLRVEILRFSHLYYQDRVTVTNKGLQMELVKILTIFTAIDLSSNRLQGEIPDNIGALRSLYVLNLSHNALTGPIPSSIGRLALLGSLDLSSNKLNGSIPVQLASITFLSFLNLSHNRLVGMIPTGSQFQTFESTSFEGNKELCGFPLNISCSDAFLVPPSASVGEFNWQYIVTGLGFGVGAAIVVGPLMFWKQGRHWCDERISSIIMVIFPSLGFIYISCNEFKVEAEDNTKEEPTDDAEVSRDEEEDESFNGRFCVFCSKLDIRMKKAIHDPNCMCHESPPISSSSSSSSS